MAFSAWGELPPFKDGTAAGLLESMAAEGWKLRDTHAEFPDARIDVTGFGDPYPVYALGIRTATVTLQFTLPPAPKSFARKLRRYDVRRRKASAAKVACSCGRSEMCDGCRAWVEDSDYCEQCNDYH